MSDDNKARMRQFYDEVVQNGNLGMLDQLFAPEFVDHSPGPDQAPGVEGVRHFFTALAAAVTDRRVSVDQIVAEGDMVAAHVTIRGRHTGDLMGIPPAGRDIVIRVSDVVRIKDGKAVERWGVEDMSGFIQPG